MTDAPPLRAFPSGAFQPLLALSNRLAGPALLFLLMVLAFWRILLTDQYTWLNGYDLSSQVLPWLQFQASEWQAGRIPLWSPYEWAGQNLIGQGQPGVVNPLNWLLFAAPLRRGWLREGVLHWWFFLIHYIGALNLYWLARSLGASRLPAVFGGLVFGLFGFLGSNDWPQMLSGVVWAPLVFRFLLSSRTSTRPWRDGAWAGFFLGLSWLSGHHQLPIFVSLSALACAVTLRIYPAALSFAIGGLIAAPQLLTGLAYGKLAVRWVGMENPVGWQDKVAYYVHEQFANPPAALLSILLPGAESHTSLFLGATALLLAIYALKQFWDRAEVRFFLWLGVAALLYNFGRSGGLEPILYSLLPMIEKARSPSMAAAMFTLPFAVLAALGLDRLRGSSVPAWIPRAHWGFSGAVILLFAVAKLFPASTSQLDQRWFGVALASLVSALVYQLGRGQVLVPALLAVLLIESANMTYFNMANRHDPKADNLLRPMSRHMDVRDFLATRPGPVRVTVDDQAMPFNFGDWHGIEVMGGYLASLTKIHTDVDWFTQRSLQLLGVGYHVGPGPKAEGSTLLLQGEGGINVWQYPLEPNPRAWLSSSVLPYRNLQELKVLMGADSVDLSRQVLSPAPLPGLGNCAGGEAVVLRHEPGKVVLRAHAQCASLLVLADSDDPGWAVKVDGQAAEKLTVFHALRAVAVPTGPHTVEWTYSPPGFRPGLALCGIGLLIFGWQVGLNRTRKTRNEVV